MVSYQAPFPETILAQQHAPFVFTLAFITHPPCRLLFLRLLSFFLLLPFSVLAPSLNVRGSKPFERNHKTHSIFLSLRWERRLLGSNPWAWQQDVMDMATLQAPKLYHVHTHLSLLSLFPPTSPTSPPPPSLSLLALSRGSKAKRKQARKEQSTHQRVWENYISGRYIRAE
jgi:hypothetical protein